MLCINNAQIIEKSCNICRVDRKTESSNSVWHKSSSIVTGPKEFLSDY